MNAPKGPTLPALDILNDYEHGKFVISNLAAKRAKQLKEGAPPLVRVDSHHPLTIALAEIAAGKIRAILGQEEDATMIDGDSAVALIDDTVPAERGLLLPALEDTEADLIGVGSLLADDHDHEEEEHHDGDVPSLSDLLDDTETEVASSETSDDGETVSLSDIADEESAAEEGEEADL